MANYSELCTASGDLLGTGRGTCAKSLGADIRFFITEDAFQNTAANLKLEATWTAGILAGTVFPFPEVMEIEPQNIEAAYHETASGSTFKMKNEKRKTMYKFVENIVTHSGMKSYSDRGWKIWFYTKNGYLRGHTLSADLYQGLSVSNFFVNAQETATFDAVEQTPVVVEFEDANDWDEEFVVLQPSFNMMDLEGAYECDVTVNSATNPATTLTVTVAVTLKGTNTAVTGIVFGQFSVIDESGVSVSVDSAVEVGSTGVYAVVCTDDATTGTVGLLATIAVGTSHYQSLDVAFAV